MSAGKSLKRVLLQYLATVLVPLTTAQLHERAIEYGIEGVSFRQVEETLELLCKEGYVVKIDGEYARKL